MRASILAALALASAAAPALAQELSLAEAVRRDDRAAVQELLARGASPNDLLPDSSSVLAWAVDRQNADIVRLLLAAGAEPNSADIDGLTPLLLACQLSDASIVQLLLDAKADMRVMRRDRISSLEVCAKTSSASILERFIAAGADPNAADLNGQTPLMWAAAGGKPENIAVLLKHGAQVNARSNKGFTPLFFAVKSNSADAVKTVLDAGGDINHAAPDGTTALLLATYERDFKVATMLVERGAKVDRWDENGNQPLHVAAIAGDAGFARLLLSKGADVNAVTQPPRPNWQTEPNAGRLPIPKFVGMTPLLSAASFGNAEVMKVLVAAGAKTDFRADDGGNVVLAAATGGSVAALDYAIQLAPNLKVKNDAGLTPMHLVINNRRAQVTGHLSPETADMVRLLASKGAPLNEASYRGRRPSDGLRNAPAEVATAYEEALQKVGLKLADLQKRQQP